MRSRARSLRASISASSTITLHCFQVASSCILPSIVHAAAVGDRVDHLLREAHLVRVGAEDPLCNLDLDRVKRPGADAAEQERGPELRLAPSTFLMSP